MLHSRRLVLLGALSLAGLAACQTAPAVPPPAPIDFSNFGPIVLDVASIEVVDRHRPGEGAIDGRAPTPPADAVRRWVAQRLKAGGTNGKATVTIIEATVTERQLPVTEGVKGFFTNDQSARYNGRLVVEVSAQRTSGTETAHGTTRASADASATVAEKSSPAERDAVLQDVVRTLADTLNARLDTGIRKDLARLVLR